MYDDGKVENDVLHGKDGWLFLWQGGHQQFEFLLGRKEPSADSIDNFRTNIEARASLCDRRKLGFQHIVFPSKPTVMSEFLPETVCRLTKSLFEAYYEPSLNGDIKHHIFYPRHLLLKSKESSTVFRKYDTHLTSFGALLIACAILQKLGYDHDPAEHMIARMQPAERDLANMIGLNVREDEITFYTLADAELTFDNRKFLPSNGGNVCILHNPKSLSDKRLLALGDSFLKNSLRALSTFYRDILYVRSELFQPDLLDSFVPDDVITANAERYLSSIRSDKYANSVLMQGYGLLDYNPSKDFIEALLAQLARGPYRHRYENWVRNVSKN